MSKSDLVAAVAAAGLTKKDAATAVDTVLDSIVESLVKGEAVSIIGFGTFSIKERAERQGRNPATGEPMTIAAGKSVAFKAGKALKDKVK
ncbi:MAG: HU family DNA-binding protein [Clostridia bacterium]|nr:HU family DNA-binding protein [Clostridia bacterium]